MVEIIGGYDRNDGSSQSSLKRVTAEDIGKKTTLHTKVPDYAEIIDQVSDTVTYICRAPPGTASSESAWQIKRVTKSGTVTTIEWADGNALFDNVADDRASLSYS